MTKNLGWKEIGLAGAAILLNAALLTYLVGEPAGSRLAFAQAYNNGFPCLSPSQCDSGFCVDGVCCASACDQPGQICNLPGSEGACISPTQAPVMSFPLQWLAAALVALITIFRFRRRWLR
jgi:hypothetical protein